VSVLYVLLRNKAKVKWSEVRWNFAGPRGAAVHEFLSAE
jgi:hypothetical protein